MDELPDNSVHQMITSPPYNASIINTTKILSLKEYFGLALFFFLQVGPTESWLWGAYRVSVVQHRQFRTQTLYSTTQLYYRCYARNWVFNAWRDYLE